MRILRTSQGTRVDAGFSDPRRRTSRHSLTNSSLATRSIQKTGGLFNTCQSFEGGLCESPLESLFPAVGLKDELMCDITDFFHSNTADQLLPVDGYQLDDVLSTSFGETISADTIDFETFTSLAQLVNMDTLNELTENEHNAGKVESDVDKTVMKRTASAAFPTALLTPIPTSDHNYHVPEDTRRQRYASSSAATNDDNESICSMDANEMASMSDTKRAKYLERRKKNNVASKRSREIRKNKFVDMEVQAEELERSNADLRNRIVELERLTRQMKAILVEKLAPTAN